MVCRQTTCRVLLDVLFLSCSETISVARECQLDALSDRDRSICRFTHDLHFEATMITGDVIWGKESDPNIADLTKQNSQEIGDRIWSEHWLHHRALSSMQVIIVGYESWHWCRQSQTWWIKSGQTFFDILSLLISKHHHRKAAWKLLLATNTMMQHHHMSEFCHHNSLNRQSRARTIGSLWHTGINTCKILRLALDLNIHY